MYLVMSTQAFQKKKKKIIGTLDIGYGDENILKEDAEKK